MVTGVMLATSIFHILWCYLFVKVWGFEVVGASIALLISLILNFALITLLCAASRKLRPSFFFFTRETFADFDEYLKIAIPSALMLCLDWGGMESFVILAGFIGVNEAGA